MKITNYYYGYLFDCSIHGKITMTSRTWKKAVKYLRRSLASRKFMPSYPWVREMFENDILSPRIRGKNRHGRLYTLLNIRVPATEELVKKFKLKGYKRANYMIEILA